MNKKEILFKYEKFLSDYSENLSIGALRVACYFFQKMYLECRTTIELQLNQFMESGCAPYNQDPFITFTNKSKLSNQRILSAFEQLKNKQLFTITRIENRIPK